MAGRRPRPDWLIEREPEWAQPGYFPGAQVETWADAPTRCRRCDGPFRRDPTGLTCMTCAHSVVVAQAIREQLHLSRWV